MGEMFLQAGTAWQHQCERLQAENDRLKETESKYNELLLAVETKHPGQSRHETALSYIRCVESIGSAHQVGSEHTEGAQ